MDSMNTRLNIKKLNGNIVQKHGGSKQVGLKQLGFKQVGFKQLGVKQVGFKQLGPGAKTGVHRVQDEKRIWFEVELQGAQGDHEAEVFQVINDDIVVAQRRLEDKQPEEKTNMDCLVYTTMYESEVAKHLDVAVIQQQNGLVKEKNVTLLAKVSCFLIQSAIGFKTLIDMLGFFGWLASTKQRMLEPVKVKCIFLRYRKGTLGTLQGVEFEVEPQKDHTFEVEPHGNADHVVGSQEVQTQDLICYHLTRDIEQHSSWELFNYREDIACKVISKWKAGLKDDMDARSYVYVLSKDARLTSGLPRVCWIKQKEMYLTLLEGHSILSLKGSLSGDYDVEKNGMLDKFDRGLQTDAAKEAIWLKGLAIESGFELKIVAGIATEKDAFLVDYVEGGLCVDYTDDRIVGRYNSGSNTNKAKWENDDYICRGHILNDSGATTHVCKDCCWFKTYEPVEDGSVLYMGDDHFSLAHGKGSVALEFSSGKTISLFNVLYVPKLRKNLVSGPMLNKCGCKQVYESDKYILSKSAGNTVKEMTTNFGKLDKFEGHDFRRWQKKNAFLVDYVKGGLCVDYTVARIVGKCNSGSNTNKGKVDAIAWWIDSGAITHVCKDRCWFKTYELVKDGSVLYMGDDHLAPVHGKGSVALEFRIIHETTTPYTPQQNGVAERKNRALKEMGCRAVFRLPVLKWKTLGEKGIDCIFVGYAKHSKAYKFYIIEPNDSSSINSIIESRDAIFDENHFSSIPRAKDIIPNLDESQRDDHFDDVPNEIPEPRKGFRQKEGIDYFDTYAPVACITTIRLLLALAAIHNLVIHQMDVKTTFLNGDLEEEVYMKQPEGFVMPGNEHRVCKLVKSLYGLKQAPKQWHQKIDEVVLSSGFHLNQSDKCVHSKFDDSGKGVIICLYVDDMLIFGTDQNQVDKTKKFLSSRFSMKDIGEADVIFCIKIKRENKGIVITQSHYIEKILKKFNREDCSSVSTPTDPVEKIKLNTSKPVDQLEYSRAIGCLMYAMTSTRPDIAYAIGRLKAYSDASWINLVEDSSSTSGWVFLLGGGAILWASKKQTCITGSIMESEFVALATAGKEAEWLRNLIHEISIWPKPIAPISI
uniref:Zinc finger, CCHC-type n=1 Tax=Tanacetum cinerariifolium TaxID=118510 RepID=A0A6L2KIS7_TANCI|nr:zinc finger, CCHC-type [Tanacetum cinerariifolium]